MTRTLYRERYQSIGSSSTAITRLVRYSFLNGAKAELYDDELSAILNPRQEPKVAEYAGASFADISELKTINQNGADCELQHDMPIDADVRGRARIISVD